MQVSTEDLAQVLGLTPRRLQQLENTGVLVRLAHGEWDLAASVQAYVQHRVKGQTDRRRRSTGEPGSAEAKLKAAKAGREELKLAQEMGELIPTEEAIAILDEVIGTLRADLAGVPARLTREMTWREKIEAEIDAALGRSADLFAKRAEALQPRSEPDQAAEADDA